MIKLENKNIQAVIFDMDGLMFDTEKIYTKTWPMAAEIYGYKVTEDIVVKAIGLNAESGRMYFESIYGTDFPFYKIRKTRLKIAMDMILTEGLPIKKGLYELISFLKDNDIKTAMATSSERERADKYLSLSSLENTFDCVVCGDEVDKSKPDPQIFETAAEKTGADTNKCIILEDSLNGIKAAYNAGTYAFMVPDYFQPDNEIKSMTYKVFDDLLCVRDFLQNCIY